MNSKQSDPPTTERSRSRRRRLLFKVAIILATVIVTVVAAEITLRLTTEFPPDSGIYVPDFEVGKTLAPGFQGVHYGVPVRISSRGLRDREFAERAPAGTLRILALGDSWTFGVGVARDETWPKRLESILGQDRSVEVLNTGVSGYETYHEAIRYRRGLSEFEHHVVIVGIYPVNDVHPKHEKYERLKWLHDFHPALHWLYTAPKRSYINQHYEAWRKARKRARRRERHERLVVGEAPDERFPIGDDWTADYRDGNSGWEMMKASLVDIGETARTHGATPVAVLFPDIEDLARYEDYCHPRVAPLIEAAAREAGLEWVDLFETFRPYRIESANASLRLSQGAGRTHPNAVGYELIAHSVARELEARGLLDSVPSPRPEPDRR